MTLIAHGILALNKGIKKRRMFTKAGHERSQKTTKAYHEAERKLKKLKRFEQKLNELAAEPLNAVGVYPRIKSTPTAFENVVLAVPLLTVLVLGSLAYVSAVRLVDIYKNRKAKQIEAQNSK